MTDDKHFRDTEIDNYLSGGLTAEELEAFEEHFFNCEECFADLKLREEIVEVIKEEGETIFVKYFQKQRSKAVVTPRAIIHELQLLGWKKQTLWGYGLAGLAAIAVWVIFIINPFAPTHLVELSQIEPFPYIQPHTLGATGEGKKLFFAAMNDYNSQQYESACQKLEEALRLNPQLKDAKFYLGVAYLFRNQLDKAIANLNRAVENNPNSEKVHWYLGHGYLKKGENASAKKEFQTVAKFGGERYSREAEAFLSNLETRKAKEN